MFFNKRYTLKNCVNPRTVIFRSHFTSDLLFFWRVGVVKNLKIHAG